MKDSNINNIFNKYEIKELLFKNSFILINYKKNRNLYLTRNSIKEIFLQYNIIYIKLAQEENYLIKIIFKEIKDFNIFRNNIKNLFN
jgi:hypothetical protein